MLFKIALAALVAAAVVQVDAADATPKAKKGKKKAAAAAAAAGKIAEEGDVLVLDDSNFDAAIKQYNPLLVEFYAPWCGHCKKLAPEYEQAAGTLKPEGLRIAKVDATVAKDLATRFSIQGFPTLKFFRGDASSPAEYNGPRDAAGIVSWIRKKSGPAARTLTEAAAAHDFDKAADVSVIGLFNEGSAAAATFLSVAEKTDDLPFATSTAAAVKAHYKLGADEEAVIVVNTFKDEDNIVRYTGALGDKEALISFIDSRALPTVIAFTQETAPKIFRGTIRTHFLLFADASANGYEALAKSFREVASANRGKALFVTVAPSEDRVMGYFGISAADLPAAVLVNMPEGEAMKKFLFPAGSALTAESMGAFLGDYVAGKLKPFLKSEPIPEASVNKDAPVVTVVGRSFESIVLDASKDVLLEFYAPWCGHCKNLAPIYEELGQSFLDSGITSMVIAKMDATGNEVEYPGVNVRGFPTLVFFPASKDGEPKKAIEYDGERTLEGFQAFLKKNAAVAYTLSEEMVEKPKKTPGSYEEAEDEL